MNIEHKGQVVEAGTTARTGQFQAMQVVAAAVVASMTWNSGYPSTNDWSALGTIPAGTILYGRFTALTLTSGKVVLYKE